MPEADSRVAFDLGKKCSEDVAAAIQRNLALCPDRPSIVSAAVAASLAALTIAAGVFDGIEGVPVGTTKLEDVAKAILDYRAEVLQEVARDA